MIELITCSICPRVRLGSEWREAERVIRDTASYEGELPRRRLRRLAQFDLSSPRRKRGRAGGVARAQRRTAAN
jgi:hypothetical protein